MQGRVVDPRIYAPVCVSTLEECSPHHLVASADGICRPQLSDNYPTPVAAQVQEAMQSRVDEAELHMNALRETAAENARSAASDIAFWQEAATNPQHHFNITKLLFESKNTEAEAKFEAQKKMFEDQTDILMRKAVAKRISMLTDFDEILRGV